MTEGAKFGCDLLLYSADPLICHAKYMFFLQEEGCEYTMLQLASFERLATSANKNAILGTLQTTKAEDSSQSKREIKYIVIGRAKTE